MIFNKTSKKKKIVLTTVVLLTTLFLLYYLNSQPPSIDKLKEQTFSWLNELREDRAEIILDYLSSAAINAQGLADDKMMLDYFVKNFENNYPNENNPNLLDYHFVSKYHDYFDVLFINSSGLIFNSIKRENDFHKNLFEGELSKTKFAKELKKSKYVKFIEYEYYPPSDEFAAFFPVPIEMDNVFLGWIVLQLPLNTINTILLDRTELGKTGEIYLVKENKHLLTESRFIENAAIQNIEINSVAISKALKGFTEEEIIKDYRGKSVYSSFSKMEFLGTSLVIVAEIDEDEILTNYFLQNIDHYSEKIMAVYENRNIKETELILDTTSLQRVDVNEFSKTSGEKTLFTKGISTCSAAIIFKPEQFGYLSHIPPTDKAYFANDVIETITNYSLQFFYNTSTTNFLKEITQRIIYYEVYPSELNTLELVFIANHKESFTRAITEVIREGLDVSKIKFMYNPNAQSSNGFFSLPNEEVIVEWNYGDRSIFESSKSIKTIGGIIKMLN